MPNSANNPRNDEAIWKRIMLDSCLTPYAKIKLISIKDLMVKNRPIKALEENMRFLKIILEGGLNMTQTKKP